MTDPIVLRRVVSLAGVVREQPGTAVPGDAPAGVEVGRLAGALVEIVVDTAPQAFQTQVAAQQQDPAWANRRQRIDRFYTHADGVFYFVDLPAGEPGEGYQLRVSMPHRATRYGSVVTDPVTVAANEEGTPVAVSRVDVVLPVTEIRGQITDSNGNAVPRARVRLQGESHGVVADAAGAYELRYLLAGRPLLEVVAAEFERFTERITLSAGESVVVNPQLIPPNP